MAVDGTPQPASNEFLVNTTTLNAQTNAAIAGMADGGFVVTWQSDSGDSTGRLGIFAQRYDASGNKIGAETLIFRLINQTNPSVAALTDGGFVVTFNASPPPASTYLGYDIWLERFDADGTRSRGKVTDFNGLGDFVPSVVGLSGGGFVVSWQSEKVDGTFDILAQRYDAGGIGVGSTVQVNTTVANGQFAPQVAVLAGGGFVVAWQSEAQDGSGLGIFGQRFDANGAAVGTEFQINTYTSNGQTNASVVGLSTGGFAVAWESMGQDGSGGGIYRQIYDGSGNRVGGEFPINTYTSNQQLSPRVAAFPDGSFVVVWQSAEQDGSGYGIYGQRFDATGETLGSEFLINSNTDGQPVVAVLNSNEFEVAWTSSGDIFARHFTLSTSNRVPVASDFSAAVDESAASVLLNLNEAYTDSDAGDTFTFIINTIGTIGTVTNNNDGTFTYDPNGNFESLGLGETATDTFTYTVTDNHGASSNRATATITIRGESDGPIGPLFTTGADVVDFNHLTAAQKQAINANPESVYFGLGGNDIVRLPDPSHYKLTDKVTWDATRQFVAGDLAEQHYVITGGSGTDHIMLGDGDDLVIGSAGNDDISMGHGDDTIDFTPSTAFLSFSNGTSQTIHAAGEAVLKLPYSPSDYTIVDQFGASGIPTRTEIAGSSIFLPSATLILSGVLKAEYQEPILKPPFGSQVRLFKSESIPSAEGQLAVEMAALSDEVYGPRPVYHTAYDFPWINTEASSGIVSAANRGWHAVAALELGIASAGHSGTIQYSLTHGLYQAIDSEDAAPDGDHGEANAFVLSGIVQGKRSLAVVFAGTDQWADFLDFENFNTHYSKFKPLIEAIHAYLMEPANQIEQVLVAGHSLGGAMVQNLMKEFSNTSDVQFRAWTFGSPGSEQVVSDSRITNFVEHADPVANLVPALSHLNAPLGSALRAAADGAFPGQTDFTLNALLVGGLAAAGAPPVDLLSISSALLNAEPKVRTGADIFLDPPDSSTLLSTLVTFANTGNLFYFHTTYLPDLISKYANHYVIHGYISGATVFSDDNNNGELDPSEASTTTDPKGSFSHLNGTGPLIAFGGTDTSTGLEFKGQLSASEGSLVVTPLTTLMALLSSDALAEQKVLSSFGLSSSIDLNTFDPIAAAQAGSIDGAATMVAVAKVYDTVSLIASTLVAAGGDFSSGVTKAFAAIADAIGGPGVSLTNEAQVSALIVVTAQSEGLALGQGVADSVAAIIVASNTLLEQKAQSGATGDELLNAIAAIERVIQGTASNAIQQAGNDPDQLQVLVDAFSGENLDDAVSTALEHLGVEDTTSPTLTPLSDQTLEATTAAGAAAFFAATATDAVDGTLPIVFKEGNTVIHSGDVFSFGTHTITASAVDAAGNQTSQNFKFNVVDTTAPTLTPIANQTREAISAAGAAAFFAATATDLVDGFASVVFKEGNTVVHSGDIYGLGNHTITASTTDAAGNLSSETFTINVKDTTAPTLTSIADQTLQATTAAGAAAFFTTTASDLVDGSNPVVFKEGDTIVHSGDIFGIGVHTITASVIDAAGNTATDIFEINVVGATSHNHDPVAIADSNGVAKGKSLSLSANKGVLANDIDSDGDHLSVGSVNGSVTNVGHAIKGDYGTLTLNADGSYSYLATAKALPSQIFAQDTFTYTTVDGHGGSDTSTLTFSVVDPSFTYKAGSNTILSGGNGKNVLDGSAGHAVAYGGNGADVLIGGNGDILAGGKGPDQFVFRPDFGVNTILDFDVKNDRLQFDNSTFDSVKSILDHTTSTPLGALISDGHGDSVLLLGVNKSQLLAHSSDLLIA